MIITHLYSALRSEDTEAHLSTYTYSPQLILSPKFYSLSVSGLKVRVPIQEENDQLLLVAEM